MNVQTVPTQFQCNRKGCKSRYNNLMDVKRHQEVAHQVQIKCPYCNIYVKPAYLPFHYRVSNHPLLFLQEPKMFQTFVQTMNDDPSKTRACENCKKFVSKSNYSRHLKVCPTNEFRCSFSGCGSSFKNKYQVKSHENKVHQERIQCQVENCKKFIKPTNMSEHVKSVHGKIACDGCGLKFSLQRLQTHLKICDFKNFNIQLDF